MHHSQSCQPNRLGHHEASDPPKTHKRGKQEMVFVQTVYSDLHWASIPHTNTHTWQLNGMYIQSKSSNTDMLATLSCHVDAQTHTIHDLCTYYRQHTSASVKRSPMVVSSSRSLSSWILPVPSSSKQAKALRITSSGSVPMRKQNTLHYIYGTQHTNPCNLIQSNNLPSFIVQMAFHVQLWRE